MQLPESWLCQCSVFNAAAVARCLDARADVPYYNRNREVLYNGLKELGFDCIKPQGAFYLFVKSPVEDEKMFCEAAKKHRILLVPGASFACRLCADCLLRVL